MKKYAVKAVKGREFLYSKKDVIELGVRTQKILDRVIGSLNALTQGQFVCKDGEVWRVCDDAYMCEYYAEYKAVVGKSGIKIVQLY